MEVLQYYNLYFLTLIRLCSTQQDWLVQNEFHHIMADYRGTRPQLLGQSHFQFSQAEFGSWGSQLRIVETTRVQRHKKWMQMAQSGSK